MIPSKLKDQVLQAAGWKCQICGRLGHDLDICHIKPSSQGGDASPDNLMAVCRSCHLLLDQGRLETPELREYARQNYAIEKVVAEIFSSAGYSVLNSATGRDGGVDIIAQRSVPGAERPVSFLIQCKASERRIDSREVLDFANKVNEYGSRIGIFVTTSHYTRDALKRGSELGIRLIEAESLARLLGELEGVSES